MMRLLAALAGLVLGIIFVVLAVDGAEVLERLLK